MDFEGKFWSSVRMGSPPTVGAVILESIGKGVEGGKG